MSNNIVKANRTAVQTVSSKRTSKSNAKYQHQTLSDSKYYVVIDFEECTVFRDLSVQHKQEKKHKVKDEITQIGAVVIDRNGKILRQFSEFVHPIYGKLTRKITELTHITKDDLNNASELVEVLRKFALWLPKQDFQAVSWGIDDWKQLRDEIKIKRINLKQNKKIKVLLDNWIGAQHLYGVRIGYSQTSRVALETARKISSIESSGLAHNALIDAIDTASIFGMMLRDEPLILDRDAKNDEDEKRQQQHLKDVKAREARKAERAKQKAEAKQKNPEAEAQKAEEQEPSAVQKVGMNHETNIHQNGNKAMHHEEIPEYVEMDDESAKKSLIVFNGRKKHPLPQDLFELWHKITDRHYSITNTHHSYNEIDAYYPKTNTYKSYDSGFWVDDFQIYCPYNSSVGLSLYYDKNFKHEMFYIALAIDEEGIEYEYLQNRNGMLVQADKWLEDEYNRWANILKENPNEFSQTRKFTSNEIIRKDIKIYNDFVCETCLFNDLCDRVGCMKENALI